MVWASQSLHVTSVKLCHLLGYDDSLDRLFGFAQKKLHIPQKTVSDHHCYFKIVIWGIFQLRANQFHVASVLPCPVRSQFYPIISPWHPHIIYIYMLSYLKACIIIIWLVVSTPLKNISQLGIFFPIYGKIKMFQTTNR